MKGKVLIGPSTFAVTDTRPLAKLRDGGFQIVPNPFGRKFTKDELLERLEGVVGLIAGLETLDRDVLQRSGLKVISRCGAGTDNVDLKAARELGIKVYSTPDAPTAAVAELALGAMIALLRSIPQMDSDLHDGKWTKKIGFQLGGKTVAIIGFGRIGRYVATLLKGFNVTIVAVDPALKLADALREGVEVTTLGDAISRADLVTIHVSGDQEIIGKKELASMKKGVYLCNGARGSVVNEDALVEAIEEGRVAGVWLDAFAAEPYTGPLAKCDRAILTPHVGSYTRECRSRMEMESVDNLLKGFREL